MIPDNKYQRRSIALPKYWQYHDCYTSAGVAMAAAWAPTTVIAQVALDLYETKDVKIQFSAYAAPDTDSTIKKNFIVGIYRDAWLIKYMANGCYRNGVTDGYLGEIACTIIDPELAAGNYIYYAKGTLINLNASAAYVGTASNIEMIIDVCRA